MGKLILIFMIISHCVLNAQNYIDQWGIADYNGWPILNDSATAAGDAGLGGQTKDNVWATLRGGFGQTVGASLDSAVIVSGQLEFIGDGPGPVWNTGLRFALTWQEDEGILEHQYTDSAAWSVNGGHYGYEFTPTSGPDIPRSGAGGGGTVWTIIDSNWVSTYSNNGWAISDVHQVPYPSEIEQGVYDWAISVRSLSDGTNEVRWYLISEDKTSYWFAGIAIDTARVTTKFNGICFGIGPFVSETLTQFNLTKVRVDKGNPIEIPPAPWQKYYIDQWGEDPTQGYAWSVTNDTNTVAGNAGITGTQPMATNGASLYGGFGQDITIPADKAIVVNGQIQFIGSPGDSYTALRYAITYRDSMVLHNALTDSAKWIGADSSKYFGYIFTPRSGGGTQPNGGGGNGSVWTIINGNWASIYSNGGSPVGPVVNQAPRNALITEGTYDWAVSVQQINDSTNEVRWSLIKTDEKYWFTGTVMAPRVTDKLNGIGFWTKDGEHTRFNVISMTVDLGDPLPNPPQCWCEQGYIGQWGIIGDRFAGWTTTPGDLVGNVTVSGDNPNNALTAVRGEFLQSGIPPDGRAFIVQGELELDGGGFETANSLRFGIFKSANAGELITEPPDSMRWTGSENKHSGYLFIPPGDTNSLAKWGKDSEPGNWGAVVNNIWFEPQGNSNYAMGSALQYPADAVAGAGIYNFEISISLADSGGREIRFKLIKKDGTYGFAGCAIDDNDLFDTDYFNCISFAMDSGNTITALILRDVLTTYGDPITLPEWITSAEQPENSIPNKFSLSQNYPNPFNPVTRINYTIPYSSDVSLKVYNILGQEVATLFKGNKKAGHYTAVFDGSGLSSGVYYYRMVSKDFTETKKLILMK